MCKSFVAVLSITLCAQHSAVFRSPANLDWVQWSQHLSIQLKPPAFTWLWWMLFGWGCGSSVGFICSSVRRHSPTYWHTDKSALSMPRFHRILLPLPAYTSVSWGCCRKGWRETRSRLTWPDERDSRFRWECLSRPRDDDSWRWMTVAEGNRHENGTRAGHGFPLFTVNLSVPYWCWWRKT